MPSRAAIALFARPSASSSSTCTSRGVSGSSAAEPSSSSSLSLDAVLRRLPTRIASTSSAAAGGGRRAAAGDADDEQRLLASVGTALGFGQRYRLTGEAEEAALQAAMLEHGLGRFPGDRRRNDDGKAANLRRGRDASQFARDV